jgi:hypothetical protein
MPNTARIYGTAIDIYIGFIYYIYLSLIFHLVFFGM